MVTKIKNLVIIIIFVVIIILVFAWAPWLTEDYGKEKILNYFKQEYNIDKNDIIITSIEKKPFEMHFGISFSSLRNYPRQQTSVHTWVTFYGKVKHDKFMTTT